MTRAQMDNQAEKAKPVALRFIVSGAMVVLSKPEPIAARRPAKKPNATTRQAIRDVKEGKDVVHCKDAKDIFGKLGM